MKLNKLPSGFLLLKRLTRGKKARFEAGENGRRHTVYAVPRLLMLG